MQSYDFFETRMECVANFSDCLRFGGKVTITCPPNETATGANCKNYFRQVGCERDDAVDGHWDGNTSAGIIRELASDWPIRDLTCRGAGRPREE